MICLSIIQKVCIVLYRHILLLDNHMFILITERRSSSMEVSSSKRRHNVKETELPILGSYDDVPYCTTIQERLDAEISDLIYQYDSQGM